MANIDIERISDIKEELQQMNEGDVLFIDENGKNAYAIMRVDLYDALEDVLVMMNQMNQMQIAYENNENIELSYEEYERIKEQIMDALERTLMPKPEKLN